MSVDDNIYIIPKGTPPVPKLAIAAIVILVVILVVLILHMRSATGKSQETVPGQEIIIGVDGATFYVPKDAITLAGVISISPLESNLYSNIGEESQWFRSQVVDIKYLNGKGIPYQRVTFPKPALICFKIKDSWDDYTQHPDEYLVQYYAEKQKPPEWVTLSMSAKPDRYELCGQTDHLSIFALAVKPQTEIPITGGLSTSTAVGFAFPTSTPTGTLHSILSPTPTKRSDAAGTPISTQAALTATSVARTATNVPTAVPTNVPPTSLPTKFPTLAPTDAPTAAPTDVPPTNPPPPPPTNPPPPPPTDPPTNPPTEPPVATDPPAVP